MKLYRLLWTILYYLSSCGFFLTCANAAVPAAPAMPPTMVSAVQAKQIEWQPKLSATGTLVAEHGIVLKTEVDGRIINLFFQSGQTVQKGQPLVQLNPDVLNAQLKDYQAELTLTQLVYVRSQGLFAKHVVAKSDYDQAVANYESAQAKVAQVIAELNQLRITAPFTGKIGLAQVSIGDFVSSGDSLVNLQSIDPIYADFNVPESISSQIKIGQKITITSPAYPHVRFSGQVLALESLIDPDTRTLKVRAILANPQGKLIPGAFVEVKLALKQRKPYITVPQTALFNAPDGSDAIYVAKNNHAVLTKIKLLKMRDADALIASGINKGDQVITAGQLKLHDQALVQIAS